MPVHAEYAELITHTLSALVKKEITLAEACL